MKVGADWPRGSLRCGQFEIGSWQQARRGFEWAPIPWMRH